MQAIILGCLLCLQSSNPCDSNQLQSFSQDPSCAKCLTDLQDHFQLPLSTEIPFDNSTSSVILPPRSTHPKISSETIRILQDLLADAEHIAQTMNQNPNEVYDLVNKIGTEIGQGILHEPQVQGTRPTHQPNEETIQRVQKQENLLEKINKKFKSFFHSTEEILSKLSSMKNAMSNEETKSQETKGSEEESKRRRDSIMPGEKLMVGEYLTSKNGEYKFVLSATTGESIVYDRRGTVVKNQTSCMFPKPTPQTLHMVMGESLEYYLDIWNGKSANLRCSSMIPMDCVPKDSKCFIKLDNDGYLKMCNKDGEPVYTLF